VGSKVNFDAVHWCRFDVFILLLYFKNTVDGVPDIETFGYRKVT